MVLGFPCCCWPYLPFLGCATWVFLEVSLLLLEKVASEEPLPRGLDPSLALPQSNPSRRSHYPNQIILSGGTHRSWFHVYCAPELSVLWKLPVPYPASACQGSQSHKHTVCWCSLYWRGRGARVWSCPASQWGHSQALHAVSLPAEVFVLRPYSFLALGCSFWAEMLHLIFNQIMSLTMTFVVFPHTLHKQDFKVI